MNVIQRIFLHNQNFLKGEINKQDFSYPTPDLEISGGIFGVNLVSKDLRLQNRDLTEDAHKAVYCCLGNWAHAYCNRRFSRKQ